MKKYKSILTANRWWNVASAFRGPDEEDECTRGSAAKYLWTARIRYFAGAPSRYVVTRSQPQVSINMVAEAQKYIRSIADTTKRSHFARHVRDALLGLHEFERLSAEELKFLIDALDGVPPEKLDVTFITS